MLANNNKNVKLHTIKSLLKWAFLELKETSASSELDAEVILSFVIGTNREFLHTHPEKRIIGKIEQKFKRLIGRRRKHEPVAYIVGRKEFYGLDFKVNNNVLIPRPETEIMVDEVMKIIENIFNKFSDKTIKKRELLDGKEKLETRLNDIHPPGWTSVRTGVGQVGNWKVESENSNFPITLIDVGTGSGCIPIAVAKNLIRSCGRMRARIYGIDISKKALKIAKENAKMNGVGRYIEFLYGDLLGNIGVVKLAALIQGLTRSCPSFITNKVIPYNYEKRLEQKIDYDIKQREELRSSSYTMRDRYLNLLKKEVMPVVIITANLPYLPDAVYRKCPEDVKNYEPKDALAAGRDGLKHYRRLFKDVNNLLGRFKKLFCHFEETFFISLHKDGETIKWRNVKNSVVLLCEIDPTQKRAIKILAKKYFPKASVQTKKDLCGLERLVILNITDLSQLLTISS